MHQRARKIWKVAKGILRNTIAFLLYYTGLLVIIDRVLSKICAPYLMIFVAHRVIGRDGSQSRSLRGSLARANYGMDADVFEKRLAHVLRRFQVISLSEAVQHVVEGKHFAKRCAVITVDDGYRECHSVLLPMFLRYHVPATLFITTGVIETGKTFWFDRLGDAFFATCSQVIEDDQLGVSENIDRIHDKIRAFRKVLLRLSKLEDAERERLVEEICAILNGTGGMQERLYLTWKEIKNMAQSPMLTIGTHSTNHSNLSKAGLECAKGEIEGSAASIERHTGIAVRFVAYPGGVYSPALLEWLRTSTFQGACSSSIGVETDPYRLKRVDMAQQPSYLFTFEISVPNMLFRRWKSKRSGQKSEKPNI